MRCTRGGYRRWSRITRPGPLTDSSCLIALFMDYPMGETAPYSGARMHPNRRCGHPYIHPVITLHVGMAAD